MHFVSWDQPRVYIEGMHVTSPSAEITADTSTEWQKHTRVAALAFSLCAAKHTKTRLKWLRAFVRLTAQIDLTKSQRYIMRKIGYMPSFFKILLSGIQSLDLVIAGSDDNVLRNVREMLTAKFQMKDLGKLKSFLDIDFQQSDHCVKMSQERYVGKILDRFDMQDCKPRVLQPLHDMCRLPGGGAGPAGEM